MRPADSKPENERESERESAPALAPDSPDGSAAPWRLGFWSLVVTQFQGAFNDNALKFLVIYLVVDMGLSAQTRDWVVLLVGALFALPFILFSMTGGFLADRFSKRSVTIGTKWMEVGVMTFSLLALARGSLALESVGVFLLSSQAALFGPSKYGLLPEILPEKELSWGNGIIELGTFLASIAATVAAGFLAYYFPRPAALVRRRPAGLHAARPCDELLASPAFPPPTRRASSIPIRWATSLRRSA